MAKKRCTKHRFRDSIDAKLALARATSAFASDRRREKRVYFCNPMQQGCGAWHLTSQEKRGVTRTLVAV